MIVHFKQADDPQFLPEIHLVLVDMELIRGVLGVQLLKLDLEQAGMKRQDQTMMKAVLTWQSAGACGPISFQ